MCAGQTCDQFCLPLGRHGRRGHVLLPPQGGSHGQDAASQGKDRGQVQVVQDQTGDHQTWCQLKKKRSDRQERDDD